MKVSIYFTAIILLFTQCRKENPYVDESVIKALELQNQGDGIQNVAIIFNNDVYYLNNFDAAAAVRLTNSPTIVKSYVALSYDKSKIAYVENGNKLVIIKTADGKVIDSKSGYTYINQIGWSGSDKSLFIREGNSLSYYGEPLGFPDIDLNKLYTERLYSISLSKNGDWIYIRDRYDFWNGTRRELVIVKANKEELTFIGEFSPKMSYVQFSANGRDFVVGLIHSTGNYLDILELYNDYSGIPVQTWQSSEKYSFPNYNRDVGYFVCGKTNTDGITMRLTAIYTLLEAGKDKFRDEFNNTNNPLFVDWK